jgi:hypothetical protein
MCISCAWHSFPEDMSDSGFGTLISLQRMMDERFHWETRTTDDHGHRPYLVEVVEICHQLAGASLGGVQTSRLAYHPGQDRYRSGRLQLDSGPWTGDSCRLPVLPLRRLQQEEKGKLGE